MNLTAGASLVPGAGQSVAFTISVPAGLGAGVLNADGKLELNINTGSAYLKYASCTGGTISGEGSAFTVVLDNYDSSKVNTITCNFTTTDGNTAGTRTITVSHPYLDSASAQTVTAKAAFTLALSSTTTTNATSGSVIHGSDENVTVTVTLPDGLPASFFVDNELTFNMSATSEYNALGSQNGGDTMDLMSTTASISKADYDRDKRTVVFTMTTTNQNVAQEGRIFGPYAKTTTITVSNSNFVIQQVTFKTSNSTSDN